MVVWDRSAESAGIASPVGADAPGGRAAVGSPADRDHRAGAGGGVLGCVGAIAESGRPSVGDPALRARLRRHPTRESDWPDTGGCAQAAGTRSHRTVTGVSEMTQLTDRDLFELAAPLRQVEAVTRPAAAPRRSVRIPEIVRLTGVAVGIFLLVAVALLVAQHH